MKAEMEAERKEMEKEREAERKEVKEMEKLRDEREHSARLQEEQQR